MPNVLNAQGLTVATQQELYTNLSTAMQQIYGVNINLASDTPDGQMLNLFIQTVLDLQDLLVNIYNTFDPDNAAGNVLYQRCAINGVLVQAGTATVTPVTITIAAGASVNLYGLDQTAHQVYTVSDAAGNLWQLQTTELGVTTGAHVYNFQSAVLGAITTTPNTITIQSTVVLGVQSVNNPTTYSTLGINQESDAALKLRRSKSVSLASQGYLAGLLAALENINGVTSAFVYENDTNIDDDPPDAVPGHSIWVITAGSGDPASIANAIYTKRNAGCGMYGEQSYVITQVDGSLFTVFWDDVQTVNLFMAFTATSLNGTTAPSLSAILSGLPLSFIPTVNQEVNINGLATLVQQIDSNTLITNAGFSTGATQILTLSGVAASGHFKINYNGDTSDFIAYTDSAASIQANLRANVTGLETVVVTGSISSQTLTFDLSSIISNGNPIEALLYVVSNTLATSVPAAITFAYNEGYTNTLAPTSKKYQFVVSSANIVITPIELLPSAPVIPTLAAIQFAAYGGYGTYTYAFVTNASGGSLNTTTGAYIAGASGPVTDIINVTDGFGNVTAVNITVT